MANNISQTLNQLGLRVFERGWLSANNMLCLDPSDQHTALVDTGYGTHADQTVALVQSVLGERTLNRIVNTHLHSDHCGGNAALQALYPQALTSIPPEEASAVRAWDPSMLSYEVTGQYCPRFTFDETLAIGSTIKLGQVDWQIHAAAGHDPHSVVLFEPETKTLISADALWQNGFGVVFPELSGESGFAEAKDTLDLIANLHPQTVIPGHGAVFANTADTPHAVQAALDVAYRRLSGFVANPAKHAKYAAKVLLKYKLLEWQTIPYAQMMHWALSVPYFAQIAKTYFQGQTTQALIEGFVQELVSSGAAAIEGADIVNA